MITKEECIIISCDNCGEAYEDNSGFSIFSSESDTHPEDDGWHVDEDKHCCPDCHVIDDNDNIHIKVKEKK